MTRAEESLQQAEKTRYHFNLYSDWQDLFEWQSVCYAISVDKKAELIYVNGRFIREGIETIDGVINYIKEKKLDALILAIDFEKAFDSLEWGFLWKTLELYGIPMYYIDMIKTVYRNIETCVLNGGYTAKYFKVTRSARQGDPLSATIFILALEILLIRIRKNKDIKGIKIGDEEVKLSSYADDLTNFLSDSRSVAVLFHELQLFSRYSGLRCNNDKTEAMKLGDSNMDHGEQFQIKMVDAMKITGIIFSFNAQIQIEKNYEGVLEDITNSCARGDWLTFTSERFQCLTTKL